MICYQFTLLTACSHGYFGRDCLHKCSTYCSGNGSCSRFTGVCDEGCKDGWSGLQCGTRINRGMSKTVNVSNLHLMILNQFTKTYWENKSVPIEYTLIFMHKLTEAIVNNKKCKPNEVSWTAEFHSNHQSFCVKTNVNLYLYVDTYPVTAEILLDTLFKIFCLLSTKKTSKNDTFTLVSLTNGVNQHLHVRRFFNWTLSAPISPYLSESNIPNQYKEIRARAPGHLYYKGSYLMS